MHSRLAATVVCLLTTGTATASTGEATPRVPSEHRAAPTQLAYLDGPTWYAIGGSFGSQAAAAQRARELGGNWYAQKSNICTNLTPGVWMVAAGFFSGGEARRYAARVGGYAKECL